jgi:ribonuclease D
MGPGVDRFLSALKVWRNETVERSGLPPVAVANNALLKDIARLVPETIDALSTIDGIRQWQINDHGEALLAVVADVKSSTPNGDEKPPRPKRRRRRKGQSD